MDTAQPSPIATVLRRGVAGLLVAAGVCLAIEGITRTALGPPVPKLVAQMPDGRTDLFDRTGPEIIPRYQPGRTEPPIPVWPPRDRKRVVWLGGSSVRNPSMHVTIEQEAAHLSSQALDVDPINLGGPGLDTGHLLGILPDVIHLQPDAVVIYSGHNDLGNTVFRKLYSDPREARMAHIRAWLGGSRIFQMLDAHLRGVSKVVIIRQVEQQRDPINDDQRLAAHQHFERRTRSILAQLADAEIPVVISTVVSNPAFPHMSWDCPDELAALGIDANPAMPIDLTDLPLDAARAAAQAHPECADLSWARARRELDVGDRDLGVALLDALRDTDPLPLRAPTYTNSQIRQIADDMGVRLADTNAALRAKGYGIEPTEFFEDNVHLHVAGHAALAAVVTAQLAPLLGLPDPGLRVPTVAPVYSGCAPMPCNGAYASP